MATEKLRYLVTADTSGFAKGMAAVAALAAAAFAAIIKTTAEFEKELSKLEAISGATVIGIASLEKQAKDLGRTTRYTAQEVVTLQTALAKLGFTTNEILNSSGGILDLATALGVQLNDAATLAGSTIRAFSLETTETGRVVDVLAKATSSSALDFTKLTESLKYAAPIANLYNLTLEDTVGMLGAMANAGIHGSIAGTALRQTFLELDKAGISLADGLAMVRDSANPAATAMQLVKKRAAGAFAIIATEGKVVDELTGKLYDSVGAANEMRLLMEDNLIGDFTKLKSAINGVALEIGDDFIPALRWITQTMIKIINSGILLYIWDEVKILVLDVTIGIVKFGKAIDTVAYAISKGPFGIGGGDSAILLRIVAAEKALKDFEKTRARLQIGKFLHGAGIADVPDPRKKSSSTPNTIGQGGGTGGGSNTFGPGVQDDYTGSLFDKEMLNASGFKQFQQELRETQASAQQSFDGIGFAAGAATGLVNQFAQSLLGPESSALAKVAVSLVSSFVSIAIAGAVAAAATSSTKDGPFAIFTLPVYIGIGLAAIAAGLSGSGGGSKVGGGGGTSGRAAPTPSLSPLSQSQSGGGRLVAEVKGQDLRFVLQGANDSYMAIN